MDLNKKEIQLDQEDVDLIAEAASERGEHWKKLLKRQLKLLRGKQAADRNDRLRRAEAFRQRTKELSSHGPTLPADFSRRDIYFE